MKKIDMGSKRYNKIKDSAGWVGRIGGILAFDSVVIPFVHALSPRTKVLGSLWRITGLVGTYGLSLYAGELGRCSLEDSVDIYANMWNIIADKTNYENDLKNPIQDKTENIPVKNLTPEEEFRLVSDFVAESHLFEFKTEAIAKDFFEKLVGFANQYGSVNLIFAAAQRGLVPESHDPVFAILLKYGWLKDDILRAGIDKISDTNYILDCFNYRDISDTFVLLSDVPEQKEK